jgi:hypothetical protein
LNRPSFDESRVRTATRLDPGRAGSKNRYQCRGPATGGLLPVAGGEIGDKRRVEAAVVDIARGNSGDGLAVREVDVRQRRGGVVAAGREHVDVVGPGVDADVIAGLAERHVAERGGPVDDAHVDRRGVGAGVDEPHLRAVVDGLVLVREHQRANVSELAGRQYRAVDPTVEVERGVDDRAPARSGDDVDVEAAGRRREVVADLSEGDVLEDGFTVDDDVHGGRVGTEVTESDLCIRCCVSTDVRKFIKLLKSRVA